MNEIPVHRTEGRPDVVRGSKRARDFPLGEPGAPRRTGRTPAEKVADLHAILDWLDVERSIRYQPEYRFYLFPRTTYCNVYAYDYCYLAGVFLPRVWWKEDALRKLRSGTALSVVYGAGPSDTVHEILANELVDWFEAWGTTAGWTEVPSLTALQDNANAGGVSIICAKTRDAGHHGHILAVVPEHATQQAVRATNQVRLPLQSQAGARNFKARAAGEWWRDAKFQKVAWWIHP